MTKSWLEDLHQRLAKALDVAMMLAPTQGQGAYVSLEETSCTRGASLTGALKVCLALDPLNISSFKSKQRLVIEFFNTSHILQDESHHLVEITFKPKSTQVKSTEKVTLFLGEYSFFIVRV